MTPQQRKAILDAADAFGTARDHWAEILDALTERGFSISLDSVRDHTRCRACHGEGEVCEDTGSDRTLDACRVTHPEKIRPCLGGSPVVWSAEP